MGAGRRVPYDTVRAVLVVTIEADGRVLGWRLDLLTWRRDLRDRPTRPVAIWPIARNEQEVLHAARRISERIGCDLEFRRVEWDSDD